MQNRLFTFLIGCSILLISCQKFETSFNCSSTCGNKTICLIADKMEAFADGTTDIILTACIPKESDDGILNVTFEVPAGLGRYGV